MKPTNEQYMTPEPLAKDLIEDFCQTYDPDGEFHFIEPSTGCGNFWRNLPIDRRTGIELDPTLSPPGVLQQDFLTYSRKEVSDPRKTVVIGNPPFTDSFGTHGVGGSRIAFSSMAMKFILHGLSLCDTVAFILPSSFVKKSVRKTDVRVVRSKDIGMISFENPPSVKERLTAKVRCVWLIFSRVLPETENFPLLKQIESMTDKTKSQDYDYLFPVDGHKGNFFVNRWGSVGKIYDVCPEVPRPLRRDGKQHGKGDLQYLWILAKPEALTHLEATSEWIRENWRTLSPGNNASIGMGDFNTIYNWIKAQNN